MVRCMKHGRCRCSIRHVNVFKAAMLALLDSRTYRRIERATGVNQLIERRIAKLEATHGP